jgi:hypothetical protein
MRRRRRERRVMSVERRKNVAPAQMSFVLLFRRDCVDGGAGGCGCDCEDGGSLEFESDLESDGAELELEAVSEGDEAGLEKGFQNEKQAMVSIGPRNELLWWVDARERWSCIPKMSAAPVRRRRKSVQSAARLVSRSTRNCPQMVNNQQLIEEQCETSTTRCYKSVALTISSSSSFASTFLIRRNGRSYFPIYTQNHVTSIIPPSALSKRATR